MAMPKVVPAASADVYPASCIAAAAAMSAI